MSQDVRALGGDKGGCCDPTLIWVGLLLITGLVFLVDLLFVFLGFFGLLLSLVLLTFVSHGFLL
jgi:hypothetical protein